LNREEEMKRHPLTEGAFLILLGNYMAYAQIALMQVGLVLFKVKQGIHPRANISGIPQRSTRA